MKMSDFVDEIEDYFDHDLSDLGLYDDYEHWYEKRGGDPYLIIDAEVNKTRHGMNMKVLYRIHEETDMSTQEIYEKMVKKNLLQRVNEIEIAVGRREGEEEPIEEVESLKEDRELYFTDVM